MSHRGFSLRSHLRGLTIHRLGPRDSRILSIRDSRRFTVRIPAQQVELYKGQDTVFESHSILGDGKEIQSRSPDSGGRSKNSTHLVNYFFSRKELTALCFIIDLAVTDWSVDANIFKACSSGQLWQLCKENFDLQRQLEVRNHTRDNRLTAGLWNYGTSFSQKPRHCRRMHIEKSCGISGSFGAR